jgi:metal-sulfur cluster biosynthetic enzyme
MAATTQPTVETVHERLARVDDPELDESIVDLDYIKDVVIDDSEVRVTLVLPTAWCSPAFAWMMATGARDELEAHPLVETATVQLKDHMHQDEINRGVNERLDFEMVFEDAEDGIEAVKQTLAAKARMSRQYRAIGALREAGLDEEQVATLTRDAIEVNERGNNKSAVAAITLANGSFGISVPAEPLVEYLKKATETGIVCDPTDRVFATADEEPIKPNGLTDVQRRGRLTSTTVSGQGTICEGLNRSRSG